MYRFEMFFSFRAYFFCLFLQHFNKKLRQFNTHMGDLTKEQIIYLRTREKPQKISV